MIAQLVSPGHIFEASRKGIAVQKRPNSRRMNVLSHPSMGGVTTEHCVVQDAIFIGSTVMLILFEAYGT